MIGARAFIAKLLTTSTQALNADVAAERSISAQVCHDCVAAIGVWGFVEEALGCIRTSLPKDLHARRELCAAMVRWNVETFGKETVNEALYRLP